MSHWTCFNSGLETSWTSRKHVRSCNRIKSRLPAKRGRSITVVLIRVLPFRPDHLGQGLVLPPRWINQRRTHPLYVDKTWRREHKWRVVLTLTAASKQTQTSLVCEIGVRLIIIRAKVTTPHCDTSSLKYNDSGAISSLSSLSDQIFPTSYFTYDINVSATVHYISKPKQLGQKMTAWWE